MKRFFLIPILLVSLFCTSQVITENVTEIKIDETTIIKDSDGNLIDLPTFVKLMDSGNYNFNPVYDEKGNFKNLVLEKRTEEEIKLFKNLNLENNIVNNTNKNIGKKAPIFTFQDLNGNNFSKEFLIGKVMVINFWFTGCKPCVEELPELNKVYQKYKNNENIVFVAITFDTKEKVSKFLEKFELNYPISSNSKDLCDLFNVNAYPTNIIIDKEGNYTDYIIGGSPTISQELNNAIEIALAK